MNIKNELLSRLYVVTATFIIVAIVIFGQAARIQIEEGDRWRAKGDSVHLKYVAIEADRGNIMSEDGLLLASSMPFFEIRFDLNSSGMNNKAFDEHIDSLAYYLAYHTDRSLSPEDYKKFLVRKKAQGERYLLIKKNVDYNELQKFKKFPLFKYGQNRGGFIVIRKSKRERPFGQLARRTIGYVRENAQPIGIEGYFDDVLSGTAGKQLMERINRSTYIPVDDLTLIAPEKGLDVVTTLDIDLQDVVHEALKSGLQRHQADHGSVILMDVKTGAIKAISNLGKSKQYGYIETYNYAVGESTEPGSTFKLATVLSLLEDGYINVEEEINIQGGKMKFYDRTMKDSHPHGMDTVTIAKAFAISSNVGIASIANQYYTREKGAKRLYANLKSMGLTERTGIEIQGEAAPIIKDPNDPKVYYSGTTIPWMAHGYELSLTPLQLLSLYAAVANDGRKMKPYIVKSYARDGKITQNFYPKIDIKRIASKSTIKTAKRLLELVVEEGTAKSARSGRFTFAGKTGTAVTNYSKKGAKSKYQASFAGYFPADDPQYACIVTISEPSQKGYYGSSVALPIFRKIADKCFSMKEDLMPDLQEYASLNQNQHFVIGSNEDLRWLIQNLNIQPLTETNAKFGVLIGQKDSVLLKERIITKNRIPNVVGMGLRDAVYLLENEGLKVTVSGFGKVKKQSILAGTHTKGQQIHLSLG
ncbi:MAG: transpeptidase family protein [Bacteroidia bacterium]|nr:transpeptidase family protein [Bacteroidia bacterium]